MPVSVSKEDRQFQLLLALITSRNGMTKAEILRSVRGYAEAPESASTGALDRMFERDKDEIRALGAVIETVEPLGEEGETHNVMYRISPEQFAIPSSVKFTAQEMSWLDLAAQAWQSASLSDASRHALTKLKSLGVDADLSLVGFAPKIRTQERSFADIQSAIENAQFIEFDYLKPGALVAESREVAPLALANLNGRWFLYAYDALRTDFRTFLLSRIAGKVKVLAKRKHEIPAGDYAQVLLDELDHMRESLVATVHVLPGTEASISLPNLFNTTLSGNECEITHFDEDLLADDLMPFIDEIRILSPASLRAKVLERLERVAVTSRGA